MAKELNLALGVTGVTTLKANTYLNGVLSTSNITMTEIGSTRLYYGDMTGSAGTYEVMFIITGETYPRGSGQITWDGSAEVIQTGDSFARIGVAGAGLTNIDLPNQTMDIIGNITGNLSGSAGSVTGAVGSVTGAVGSVTGNVGGNVVGSTGSVTGSVGSVAGNVAGSVGSVTGTVGGVTGVTFPAVVASPTNITAGTITTVTNLTNAPTAGDLTAAMIASVTSAATAATPTVAAVTGNVGGNVTGSVGSVLGSVGSVTGNLGGNVVGSVGSVLGSVGSVTGGVTVTTNNDKTGYTLTVTPPTASTIAGLVWDQVLASHLTAGSTGFALNAAASAGDPWSTALPGSYGAGTAGSDLALIKAKTDNLPATPASTGDAMTLTGAYDFAKGTVAMPESYAANGVAPTPEQAFYAIHQMLQDFAIAGTSITVKKLDNTATAFVVTLDSATFPTSAVRV